MAIEFQYYNQLGAVTLCILNISATLLVFYTSELIYVIEFFQAVIFPDTTIPTTVLDVQNTERGHCLKTLTIFKYLSKKLLSNKAVKWIALTDDDTLLRYFFFFY